MTLTPMQFEKFIGWILAGRAVEDVHLNLCAVQSECNIELKISRDANVDTQEMYTINNSIV